MSIVLIPRAGPRRHDRAPAIARLPRPRRAGRDAGGEGPQPPVLFTPSTGLGAGRQSSVFKRIAT